MLQEAVGAGSDADGDLPDALNESSVVVDVPALDENSSNNDDDLDVTVFEVIKQVHIIISKR